MQPRAGQRVALWKMPTRASWGWLAAPAVTQDMVQSEAEYHRELARELSHLLLGDATRDGLLAQRKLLARKKFVREFIDSAAYRELLGGCFATTSQSVIDSGVIIEMISAVHVGNFERLPELGEVVEVQQGEPELLNHRVETVAQEVLRFISHISRP